MNCKKIVFSIIILFAATPALQIALADFNAGGIENFNGNSLDLKTWTIKNSNSSAQIFSQNGQLNAITDGAEYFSYQYAAMGIPIHVGDFVQTDVLFHSHDSPIDRTQKASLMLISDLPRFTNPAFNVRLGANFNISTFVAEAGVNGGSSGFNIADIKQPSQNLFPAMDTWFRLRIDWVSSSLFHGTISNLSGEILGSANFSQPNAPSSLYVMLAGSGASVSYDNVTLPPLSIPEPSSLIMLAIGMTAWMQPSRRFRRRI